ncbi:MAG: hypothetical protein APF84_13235 [Gracilibacter sp. BRH_c7a]|nr:MAG: hypothetical protein APF84_13235 [Gracilibacter sp. BRH_c7a]
MNYRIGEIWYAKYPLEENLSQYIERPVIIADINLPNLVVIKVTSHDPRKIDPYDVPIIRYKEAGLKYPSTARISKTVIINENQIDNKKGVLHSIDYKKVFDTLNLFLDN